jgi:hypothetical protein
MVVRPGICRSAALIYCEKIIVAVGAGLCQNALTLATGFSTDGCVIVAVIDPTSTNRGANG